MSENKIKKLTGEVQDILNKEIDKYFESMFSQKDINLKDSERNKEKIESIQTKLKSKYDYDLSKDKIQQMFNSRMNKELKKLRGEDSTAKEIQSKQPVEKVSLRNPNDKKFMGFTSYKEEA